MRAGGFWLVRKGKRSGVLLKDLEGKVRTFFPPWGSFIEPERGRTDTSHVRSKKCFPVTTNLRI